MNDIEVTCLSVSGYSDGLTRGAVYRVVEGAVDTATVRIQDDRNRARSYPRDLFAPGRVRVARIVAIEFDPEDPAESAVPVEAVIRLEDGESRWCWLATPKQLEGVGDFLQNTDVRIHVDNRRLHIASRLDRQIAWQLINHVWSQGLLEQTSEKIQVSVDSSD